MKKLYFLLLSFLLLTRFAALGQNDLCTGAININCGQTITGTTVGATLDAVGTCITALNTAPGVWYSFTGDGLLNTLSLCGSGYDTKIGIFSGTCAALVCVAGNDDACGLQSQVSFTSVVGTSYFVLVTGFGTNAGTFTLARTCISATAPVNDLCSGAINIGCAQTITGSTFTATLDAVGTCITALGTAPGVWYSFTGDGLLNTLSLCGSGYDTKIGIFSGSCGALVCVAGNDDACGLQSQVAFSATLGTNYFVLVTGFGTNAGAFTLARTCTAPAINDFCSGAINIACAQTITGTTSTATPDAVGTCTTALGTAPGVWYSFAGDGNIITLSLCGSAFDTKMGVFSGTCAGLTCVIGNDDFCGLQSQVTFTSVVGTNYFVLVTGFGTNSGTFTLARTCIVPCSGTPSAGTISGPATSCGANSVTLALSGNTIGSGISIQWKSAAVSGGPYTNISGATNASYIFTPSPGTTFYIATVTCANSGLSSNTPQKSLIVSVPVHSTTSANVTTVCTPGAATVTGTAINGAAGNYVHSLTGPGTIVQSAPTGANNSTGNFTVTNLPAGNHSFILTTTDALGCNTISTIVATIKQTPIITLSPVSSATICNGQVLPINASVIPPLFQSFSQATTILVPAGSPTTSAGIGGPYPSQINVAGFPTTGITVKSVKLGNVNHTFPDDMDIVLVSPTGQAVILMSDAGGGTDAIGLDYTFDDAAASLMANSLFNPQGTYRPTNFGTPDIFPAPGPGTLTQATPTLASFSGNPNGDWKLYVVDGFTGDFGFIGNWSITFAIPSEVTFSPLTNLFTDGNATIAYTGTPTTVVFARPTATTLYTASANVDGCTNSASVNIAVNQVPAITTQPTPAAQTICPGFNVTYSVAATGTGLTYQWRLGAVNLVNNAQISGANTNTLTITNVSVANSGSYTFVVAGTCTPAVTSTAAVLTVSTAPVISTQPVASVTICAGASTSLTTVATGVPAPTIYQWQVSTDAGVTWTNLLADGSFTPTYSIIAATQTMNNNRYRVLVTNSCGQTTTSTTSTLLVNPLPTVTAAALVNRICISDTLVGLSGSPVGGTWSGIGVSGFNFVPSATAVGTYNLAYTFTSALGCTASATIAASVEECRERLRLIENNALIVYPNPNRGRFNVRINSSLYEYIGMKVYNAQGQIVNGKMVNDVLTAPIYSGLVFGRVIPVDLTHLPAGVYLVKFYFDGGVRSSEKAFKVIIGSH